MKSLFVKDDDAVIVKIFLAKDKSGDFLASNNKEALLIQAVPETLEEHQVSFKKPSYGDDVSVYSSAVKIENNNIKVDPVLFRFNKFVSLARSWTFKDEGGIIPVNMDNIRKLDPGLANLILDEFEKIVG